MKKKKMPVDFGKIVEMLYVAMYPYSSSAKPSNTSGALKFLKRRSTELKSMIKSDNLYPVQDGVINLLCNTKLQGTNALECDWTFNFEMLSHFFKSFFDGVTMDILNKKISRIPINENFAIARKRFLEECLSS